MLTKEDIFKNVLGERAQIEAQKNLNNFCLYDEAFTVREMVEETGRCLWCKVKDCPIVKASGC